MVDYLSFIDTRDVPPYVHSACLKAFFLAASLPWHRTKGRPRTCMKSIAGRRHPELGFDMANMDAISF